jgi:hypothetical protein
MPKYDAFLACPISISTNVKEVAKGFDLAENLARMLRSSGRSVFFAGSKPNHDLNSQPPDFSLNLALVKESAAFVMISAEHEVSRSSIWVEAGMAFALGIPSIFVVPGMNSLPILVQRALAPIAEGGLQDAICLRIEPDWNPAAILDALLPILLPYLARHTEG